MAFTHGKDSRILANDTAVSTEMNKWSAKWEIDLAETTTLGAGGFGGTRGLMEGTMSGEGFFNSSAIAKPLYDEIQSTLTASTDNLLNMTIWPMGGTLGNPAIFAACDTTDFNIESSVDEAVTIKFEAKGDATVDMGESLHDLTAETSSTNSTYVDDLALTSNGGAAMLHVTAVSGTTPTATIKVQHSTDHVSWADLVTFTGLTTLTSSESKIVAAGTTVNRYLRVISTIAGTNPSYTYGVSFARR